jgi:hypothetical protein
MLFARKDSTASGRLPCEVQTNRQEAKSAKDNIQKAWQIFHFSFLIFHRSFLEMCRSTPISLDRALVPLRWDKSQF